MLGRRWWRNWGTEIGKNIKAKPNATTIAGMVLSKYIS